MHYFSIFFKDNKPKTKFFKTNHALSFCAFERKRQLFGNSEKIFEFIEILLQKIANNALFVAYLSNMLTNYALIFCAFGRKTQIVGKFLENFDIF